MPIGNIRSTQQPLMGAYRKTEDNYVSRGTGYVCGTVSPSIEYIMDDNLPVLVENPYWGDAHRMGQIIAGVDVFLSMNGEDKNDMGYNTTKLTICNGHPTLAATDSNGMSRAAGMVPYGMASNHCYRRVRGSLVGVLKPNVYRAGVVKFPYIQDPYYADQCWVGCATGGATTSVGSGNNAVGEAYASDYRLGSGMAISLGDRVTIDHMGHVIKYVPVTTSVAAYDASLRSVVGEVIYIEEAPMSGFLQWMMLKAGSGYPRMYDDYDYMLPYPLNDGSRDSRSFMSPDKNFYGAGYGEIGIYNFPEHLKDGMGMPGLHNSERMYKKSSTETFTNVALNSDGYHELSLSPTDADLDHVLRDEIGSVNPSDSNPTPSVVTVTFDPSGTPVVLRENVDFTVDRFNGTILVKANNGAGALAITDDYEVTYSYISSNIRYGIPTSLDWQGSTGFIYVSVDCRV